jgi:hypothetical protein
MKTKTAQGYAEFFIASDDKEDALLTIGCEFIRELQEQLMELGEEGMTPGNTKPTIFRLIDAQDQKWKNMSVATNGKIPEDGFCFILGRFLEKIEISSEWKIKFCLWKLKKTCD